MALLGGEGGSSLNVLNFHHFSLALFNLSLNYCLLNMLVANVYLFTVHFDFTRFLFFPFFISVLFILIMHNLVKKKFFFRKTNNTWEIKVPNISSFGYNHH